MIVNPKPCLCFHNCAAIMRVERCFYPFWWDWVRRQESLVLEGKLETEYEDCYWGCNDYFGDPLSLIGGLWVIES